MGLFRRGTKLLRLGSGLRDCCCRPEPEECWCPDSCSYYWQWDGGERLAPPATLLESQCAGPFYLAQEIEPGETYQDYGSFALVAEPYVQFGGDQFYIYTSTTIARSGSFGAIIEFDKRRTILGTPTLAHKQIIRDELGISQVDFIRHADWVIVRFTCDTREPQASRLKISVERSVVVETLHAPFGPFWTTGYIVNYSQLSTGIVPHVCVVDPALLCNLTLTKPPSFAYAQTPLEDAVVSWDNSRAYYKGNELSDWAYVTAPASVFPFFAPEKKPSDVPESLDAWMGGGSVPLTGQVTLKRKASCQPSGPCDCDLDLTGRTVVFEGQTFTYGSLQQFISDDGLTIWEEGPSAGRFTREDRRECDGTVTMRTRTADVSCSTFDGVPRWFVYLDSDCYERESGGCAPTVTASKITLYNGAFSCDSDGYPLGAAHSFTDDTDPPDLDQENISGTPSANCDVENPIPSISFS